MADIAALGRWKWRRPTGRAAGGRMLAAALASSCLPMAPALAQAGGHGAGVNWSGGHGGVNWDGGHRYDGGGYTGYPAASPSPAYPTRSPAYDGPPPPFRSAVPHPATPDGRRTERSGTPDPGGHRPE